MNMHLGWPQIIMGLWYLLILAVNVRHHGRPRTGISNGWVGVTVASLLYAVLFWGGFFS